MEFFYPVHYEIGTALEDVVRADVLSRQQAASLWLIRSQGSGGDWISRKEIETNVRRWFEVTSAAVSRSLRGMMRPPLELIEIVESPHSGREKIVKLTPKGRAFLEAVAARATTVVAELIDEMSPALAASAESYFGHLVHGFQSTQARRQIPIISSVKPAAKANPHLIRGDHG